MIKQHLVVSYAYLVKVGVWDLEQVEGSNKKVVTEAYRQPVAEYIANQVTTS